jgi:hypothetical protein
MTIDLEAEKFCDQHALVLFSHYTHGQALAVQELGDEILELIKANYRADGSVNVLEIKRICNLF